MKAYKVSSWLELPAPFHRTIYRRMLSDMSHRFVTAQQLVEASGATKVEVKAFLDMLEARGLLHEREFEAPPSVFGPIGGWLRKTLIGADLPH